tara:strand:+ start:848 stop:1096 length:249 start_codon:yes stop_codon:yes gene_type:complete
MNEATARNMTDSELKAFVPPTVEIMKEIYRRFNGCDCTEAVEKALDQEAMNGLDEGSDEYTRIYDEGYDAGHSDCLTELSDV